MSFHAYSGWHLVFGTWDVALRLGRADETKLRLVAAASWSAPSRPETCGSTVSDCNRRSTADKLTHADQWRFQISRSGKAGVGLGKMWWHYQRPELVEIFFFLNWRLRGVPLHTLFSAFGIERRWSNAAANDSETANVFVTRNARRHLKS